MEENFDEMMIAIVKTAQELASKVVSECGVDFGQIILSSMLLDTMVKRGAYENSTDEEREFHGIVITGALEELKQYVRIS